MVEPTWWRVVWNVRAAWIWAETGEEHPTQQILQSSRLWPSFPCVARSICGVGASFLRRDGLGFHTLGRKQKRAWRLLLMRGSVLSGFVESVGRGREIESCWGIPEYMGV